MDVRASELACQVTIVEAAQWHGWRVHAERAARRADGEWRTAIQGNVGFPDLVLVKGPRLLFVELKRKPNFLTEDQSIWGHRLSAAGADWRVVWVPEGVDRFIEDVLK